MNIAELTTFIAVCHNGSFTRAAALRHLTQPGVSRHIQRLERELGVTLFERRRRELTLTEAGHKLLPYAEETINRHERFIQSLRPAGAEISGEIRIAASTTPGEFLLPRLLTQFTYQHRGVRPQVFIGDSAEVVAEVQDLQWDLGFVGVRIPSRSLQYDVVGEDELVLIVPASHPFAKRKSVKVAELGGQPFIEREGGSGTLRAFRTTLAEQGVPVPRYRVAMTLNSHYAILSAVQNVFGLGVVSSLAIEQHQLDGVVPVKLEDVSLKRRIFMVHHRQRHQSPAVVAFADWVLRQTSHVNRRREAKVRTFRLQDTPKDPA